MIRGLDHLVLPVSSLDIARQRYEALGFSVNKDGIHPFGTSNCCVFIENGVYLEPVAVYDEALA
ncbi:MAG: VOC family protein, partial [Hyphomicrobiales bacterium]